MMRFFLNCLGASAGGGLTYLRNVLPSLSGRSEIRTTVAAAAGLRQELAGLPNVNWVSRDADSGTALRFWDEQTKLPGLIRRSEADVLISAGNFAVWRSPVPQILLSGNSLYTSTDFYRDLRARKDYRLWLDTHLKAIFAKRSVACADRTVAPSQAFADELQRWTGKQVLSIHHGFDHARFCGIQAALPTGLQQRLDAAKDALRLLFVSHYNYYRNFETLLRALPLIQRRLGRRVVLFLTCKLRSAENPGWYCAEAAAALARDLGIAEHVVELGPVPYHLLHHLYRACDLYVTPAYTETFAHPVVEAMASGLPVVAANLPVHREVCGESALYFEPFSPGELAERVLRLATAHDLREALARSGKERSLTFSWEKHVDELVALARSLLKDSSNSSKFRAAA